MESLDVMGSFWLPGHREVARYGRLVFDTQDGGSLHLSDSLAEITGDRQLNEKDGGTRGHILGLIHEPNYNRPVTLLDCLFLSRTKYHAHVILIDAHFESDEDTVFDSVKVRFNDAAAWMGQNAISVDVGLDVEGVERRELVARLNRPPRSAVRFERGEVALDFGWSRQDVDLKSLTIEQWPQFELTYDRRMPVKEIVEDTGHILNLMALCTDRPGLFDSVRLFRTDLPQKALSGTPFPNTQQAVELKARLGDISMPADGRVLSAQDVLVPFDDLGIASVAACLDKSPGIAPIIGSLLTMRHRGSYSENRFLNIASAAEGLHRAMVGGKYLPEGVFRRLRRDLREHVPEAHHRWFADLMAHANTPSLVQRLTELSNELGDSVHSLVGNDVDAWIQAIKKIRNHLTHLDEDRPTYNGDDLHHLAESLYDVTRLCLLLRIGLSPDDLPRITKSIRMYGNFLQVEYAIQRISPPQEHTGDTAEVPGA